MGAPFYVVLGYYYGVAKLLGKYYLIEIDGCRSQSDAGVGIGVLRGLMVSWKTKKTHKKYQT